MPHFPKPFFRKELNRWAVQLDGKQINLGPDKEAAFHRYHELMAARSAGPAAVPDRNGKPVVAAILDAYLDWLGHRCKEGSKARRTYEWCATFIQSFLDSLPCPGTFTADQLGPAHVYRWVDDHPGWKRSKRAACPGRKCVTCCCGGSRRT